MLTPLTLAAIAGLALAIILPHLPLASAIFIITTVTASPAIAAAVIPQRSNRRG